MRGRGAELWCVLAVFGVAGCGPEKRSEDPRDRARALAKAHVEAEDRATERDKAKLELGLRAQQPESLGSMRRRLLLEYGERLTPFQRSALQTATFSTYAQGEDMCRKWIEENRAFERGSDGQ